MDAQGGAYATGVLVLITSAATAVTLSAHRRKQKGRWVAFALIALIFAYTTIANVAERPDGVKIAACFIGGILLVSLLSRIYRAFELRVTNIDADDVALGFLRECGRRQTRTASGAPTSTSARCSVHKLTGRQHRCATGSGRRVLTEL